MNLIDAAAGIIAALLLLYLFVALLRPDILE